jgi:hypothetical protein
MKTILRGSFIRNLLKKPEDNFFRLLYYCEYPLNSILGFETLGGIISPLLTNIYLNLEDGYYEIIVL